MSSERNTSREIEEIEEPPGTVPTELLAPRQEDVPSLRVIASASDESRCELSIPGSAETPEYAPKGSLIPLLSPKGPSKPQRPESPSQKEPPPLFSENSQQTMAAFFDSAEDHKAAHDMSVVGKARETLFHIVAHSHFDRTILALIMANCVFLALSNPLHGNDHPVERVVDQADYFFNTVFAIEMLLKWLALGLKAYFSDPWNQLDFIIVSTSLAAMLPGVPKVAAVRVLRVLRPLRTVKNVAGMRAIVQTLLASLTALREVGVLLLFFFVVLDIAGLALFMDGFHHRCLESGDGWKDLLPSAPGRHGEDRYDFWFAESARFCQPDNSICAEEGEGLICTEIPNPTINAGMSGFDHFGLGLVTIFITLTTDGWSRLAMNQVDSNGMIGLIYYTLIIFVLAFFAIQLLLAVISDTFSRESQQAQEFSGKETLLMQYKATTKLTQSQGLDEEGVTVDSNFLDAFNSGTDSLQFRLKKVFRKDSVSDFTSSQRITLIVGLTQTGELERTSTVTGRARISGWISSVVSASPKKSIHQLEKESTDPDANWGIPKSKVMIGGHESIENDQDNNDLNEEEDNDDDDDHVTNHNVQETTPTTTSAASPNERPMRTSTPKTTTSRSSRSSSQSRLSRRSSLGPARLSLVRGSARPSSDQIARRSCKSMMKRSGLTRTMSNMDEAVGNEAEEEEDWEDAWVWKVEEVCGLVRFVLMMANRRYDEYVSLYLTDRSERALQVHRICESEAFNWSVCVFVMINTAAFAIEHEGMSQSLAEALETINLVMTFVFAIEMAMKVIGDGKMYPRDPFNVLDGIIVVFSFVELICQAMGMDAGSAMKVLRSLRLLRVLKFMKYFQSLREVVRSTVATLANVTYLVLLMLLFVFMLGCVGVQLFAVLELSKEDDNVTFTTLSGAMISVFDAMTGEWVDKMVATVAANRSAAPLLYFLLIIVVGNFIILNLFLAVVIEQFCGEDERVHLLEELVEDTVKYRKKHPDASTQELEDEVATRIGEQNKHKQQFLERAAVYANGENKYAIEMKKFEAKSNLYATMPENRPTVLQQEDSIRTIPTMSSKTLREVHFKWYQFRKSLRWLLSQNFWEILLILLISGNCVCLAYDKPGLDEESRKVLQDLDTVFAIVFALEMVLNMVAFGLFQLPAGYFRRSWNILDFAIVCVSLVGLFFPEARAFRAFRALRPLRLLARNDQMKVVLYAIIQSIPVMVSFVAFSMLIVLLFAVLFMQAIGGSTKDHGSFFHYGHVGAAIETLFVVVTLSGWSNLMHEAQIAVGEGIAVPLFIVFVIIGGFFLVNMLIGVLINSFQKLKDATAGSAFMTVEQQRFIETWNVAHKFALERPIDPLQDEFRKKVYYVVQGPLFNNTVSGVIILNIVQMTLPHYGSSEDFTKTLQVSGYVFFVVYCVECIMKVAGYGFAGYLTSISNKFDFCLVLFSCVEIVAEVAASSPDASPTGSGIGRLGRIFRVLRVGRALRVVGRVEMLNRLCKTMILSLPSLFNIGLLLALIFFIYAVLGVQLCGSVPWVEYGPHFNFADWGAAMRALLVMSTLDDWEVFMQGCNLSPPDCDVDRPGHCGSPLAGLFGISFGLIMSFVLLQVFIAVVLENFSDQKACRVPEAILSDAADLWKQEWKKYDPKVNGWVKASDFVMICDKMKVWFHAQNMRIEKERGINIFEDVGYSPEHWLFAMLNSLRVPLLYKQRESDFIRTSMNLKSSSTKEIMTTTLIKAHRLRDMVASLMRGLKSSGKFDQELHEPFNIEYVRWDDAIQRIAAVCTGVYNLDVASVKHGQYLPFNIFDWFCVVHIQRLARGRMAKRRVMEIKQRLSVESGVSDNLPLRTSAHPAHLLDKEVAEVPVANNGLDEIEKNELDDVPSTGEVVKDLDESGLPSLDNGLNGSTRANGSQGPRPRDSGKVPDSAPRPPRPEVAQPRGLGSNIRPHRSQGPRPPIASLYQDPSPPLAQPEVLSAQQEVGAVCPASQVVTNLPRPASQARSSTQSARPAAVDPTQDMTQPAEHVDSDGRLPGSLND